MRVEYNILANRAVRVGAIPILIDDGGLTFKFNNLSAGAYVLRIYQDSGLIEEYTLNDGGETHITRRKVKTGFVRMDIVHTDCNGVADKIIACEPIGIYSLSEQIHDPLVAYQEIDKVLEDNARLHDLCQDMIIKVEHLEEILKKYQNQTTAALADIRGAYKLNLFGGNKND